MSIRAYFVALLFLCLSPNMMGQASLEKRIDQIGIDSLSYYPDKMLLVLKGMDGAYLTFDGNNVADRPYKIIRDRNYRSLIFNANAATLDSQSIVLNEDVLDAIITDRKEIFLSSDQGLYIMKEGYPVKFYHPLAPDLGRVDKLYYYPPFLIFRNNFDQLVYWDQQKDLIDYIQLDGFRPTELRDIISDRNGMIWLADDQGVYSWTYSSEAQEMPPYLKTAFYKRNGKLEEDALLRLRDGDHLEVVLEGRHLADPNGMRYYYSLEKKGGQYETRLNALLVDEVSAEASMIFTNLKEGSYVLNTKASINGKYFKYLAPVNFKVAKGGLPLWMFLLGGLFLLLSSLLIWSRNRSKNFINQISSQRDRLKLENEALKYQQKALQLQMNPHFIFNALNAIQGLIARGDAQSARRQLNSFSQLMRSVLDQSRADEITINDELKYLKSYLGLEQMCRDQSFDFKIIVSEELDLEATTMTMIIQPFVENAVIHAFKDMAKNGHDRKGMITITLEPQDKLLKVLVVDNGLGFEHGVKSSTHQSHGLNIVQERLVKALGRGQETYQVKSVVDQGTEVIIYLPLN